MVVGQIERGKKWSRKIAQLEFDGKDTSWFKTQQSIVDDIKEYEVDVERLRKLKEEEEKKTKSKKEK